MQTVSLPRATPPHPQRPTHPRIYGLSCGPPAGLDYLASPTGAIAEAQARAAAAFGADQTWFLVNGTTVGIQVRAEPYTLSPRCWTQSA